MILYPGTSIQGRVSCILNPATWIVNRFGGPLITITRKIVEEIEKYAREEYPRECCGMLAGRENAITKLFKIKNIARSDDEYELDPLEQVKAFEEIDRLSLKLIGVYHSHPDHPCYPSALDIRQAFYPDTAYFIISLSDAPHSRLRAFMLREGKVVEEEIIID
jgi:proteasome lid subunit RPN8/RPN11